MKRTPRRLIPRAPALAGACLALALAAGAPTAGAAAPAAPAPGLDRFDSCADLVAYVRGRAPRLARDLGGIAPPTRNGLPMPAVDSTIGGDGAESAAPPLTPGTDFSGTNNQEAGVDEPDLVKTDGRRMFVVDGGTALRVLDVTGGSPKLVASIDLPTPSAHDLLLSGDRLLVIAEPEGEVRGLRAAPGAPLNMPTGGVQLLLLDVADLANVHVLERYVISGWLLGARLTGGTVRVVTQAQPNLALRQADTSRVATGATLARSRAVWRRALRRSTKANWLPVAKRLSGRTATHGPAVGCRSVYRPSEFSGVGTVSVTTIDLASGLTPTDVDTVLADGGILYASPTGLYVATQQAVEWAALDTDGAPPPLHTVIHRFDTSATTATAYRGSGTVTGTLLNQFSMSEQDGVLRVASTDLPPWWSGDTARSQSFVTTLADRDGRLVQLGRVGGLGKGERIYAVRFIGSLGYVVTFRQVDPLYVVDLADPAAPAVRGELKIRGYSAYLHPIGDGLLIGVGQDASDEGRIQGTQIALFDVKNPAAPARLSVLRLPGAWSAAEWQHHAFLWWAASNLAVIPVAVPTVSDRPDSSFVGALAVTVDRAGGVREAGRVIHPLTEWNVETFAPEGPSQSSLKQPTPILRSLVVGDALLTVSSLGVKASGLADLADRGFAEFPEPTGTGVGPGIAVDVGSNVG